MKPLLITTLTAAMCLAGATSEAQDRFGYPPNVTARRQETADRMPSHGEYSRPYRGPSRRYESNYSSQPRSDYRYRGDISDQYGWQPIYQFYHPINGDQLLSAQPQNEDPYGMSQYVSDGMFLVSSTGGVGKIPLFRYIDPDPYHGYHSYTTSRRGMRGARLEGVLGYLETRQTRDTVPLYGWYDPYRHRFLVTTNPDSQLQYEFEYLGVLGYVRPG